MNYKISTEENAYPFRVIVFIEFYNSEFNYDIVLAQGFPVKMSLFSRKVVMAPH